ncbi:plasmid mobilization relaxosome protein MobC [Streptomyces sp. A73]|nr:plasmid mobilization relaxosome protein MobC [Streptomyces sp. A73]
MDTPTSPSTGSHRRTQQTEPAPGGASCRFGHSPVGGASEPGPDAGATGHDPSQGARAEVAAATGSPQSGASGRRSKGKARLRDRSRRPAHSVRLNEREHALIAAAARSAGMSVAGFLADAALVAARDRSRTAAAVAIEREVLTELFALRRQLGWAGSNLNQAARVLNSGGDAADLKAVLDDVHSAVDKVQQVTDRMTAPDEGTSA